MFSISKIKKAINSNAFLKGSFIYILGSIFLKGVSFILIPTYTKVFTPADYGTMELINVIMSLLMILVGFGFSQLIFIEYIHLKSEEKVSYISRLNYSYSKLALLTLAFCGLGLFFFRGFFFITNSVLIIPLMIICVFFTFFQNNYFTILQLDQAAKIVTVNKILTGICLLILNVVLIKFLHIGIIAVYISNATALLISLIFFKVKVKFNYLNFQYTNKQEIYTFLRNGFPFIITSLAYFCINGVDRFIIKELLDEDKLGIYSLGFKFGSMLEPLLITPILYAYNPYIFKKYSENVFTQNLLRNIIVVISLFGTLALILPHIAKLVIDAKFFDALPLIGIFVFGFAFLLLTQMHASPLLFFKKKNALIYNVFISSLLNVLLNILLIKHFGIYGSAYAFLLTNFFWFILTIYQSYLSIIQNQKNHEKIR